VVRDPAAGVAAGAPRCSHVVIEDDVHVLLRHRLLLKPGGLEGFNAVEKQWRVGQAIAEVHALVELKLNLNVGRPS
jgi:hypothetical protein